jgi:tetratricopeptide (TPR) repeat protein
MDRQAPDRLVGTKVGHYDVIAKLGGGGMGVVYSARDTKLGRHVALKFLPHQWSHDESAKQRFVREAQAASATNHPNICTVHDIQTTEDGLLFIVMALYEGRTLKQRLEEDSLSVDEALDIATQVAEGLAKAHAQGVIHRDIKPGNLMLTDDGVRILDFGLAKFGNSLQLTLEGSTIGTVAYMSPEQTRGEEADARSDIWAVGVVLYEMLAGVRPFKGAYPEAIAHAIRNESPDPLRQPGRDISEELEQLVFRALHKEPKVRFQTGRDLARALRRVRGITIPLDLRTEPLPPVTGELRPPPPKARWWKTRPAVVAAAVVIGAVVGIPLWLFSPVERVPVAIAPIVNQTGYTELDPYRMALTEELTAELADSSTIRVLPYDRLLQIIRRFRVGGEDASSRDALQALTANSGAQLVVVPTLLYDAGSWRARVEIRDAHTATNVASYDTPSVVSSLPKDVAYELMPTLVNQIEDHFLSTGPLRARWASRIRAATGRSAPPPGVQLRSLDVAASLEQGLDAYERFEYVESLRAMTMASNQDSRNPVPLAWQSRLALLIRKDDVAAETGERARMLLADQTSVRNRLFVSAVAAESRGNFDDAENAYNDLVGRSRDEPGPLLELAGYQDRRGSIREAIATYRKALALNGQLIRPHLELCRLYNLLNEGATAKEEAQRARQAYAALGNRGGEAQALLCATETLRSGSGPDRQQASLFAKEAAGAFTQLHASYNLPRALYYLGMLTHMMGSPAQALTFHEQALKAAQDGENVVLQPRVLNNLGVTHEALGNWSRAVAYYQQGYKLNEVLGNDPAAARNRVNAGAIIIEYGGNLEEGVRDVENALAVFRKIGDKTFEAFCLQLMGVRERYAGRHVAAERYFNQALAIARERDLKDLVASLTMDLARVRFDAGDYTRARDLLLQALGQGSWSKSVEARIRLALVYARLGDDANARSQLDQISSGIQRDTDPAQFQLLKEAAGEVAYEAGRLTEARALFADAIKTSSEGPPAVEARARLGLLDALDNAPDRGRAAILASLKQAQAMGRYGLEARCRVFLARIDVMQRRFDDALQTLREIPADGDRVLGPEIQAQVHHWRARALSGNGDATAAEAEKEAARGFMNAMRKALPDGARARFEARPDARLIELQ